MRDCEAVEIYRNWEEDVRALREPEGLYGIVVCLLWILAEQLYPARVPRSHHIRVVPMDVEGRR